jgi:hypothetical protein
MLDVLSTSWTLSAPSSTVEHEVENATTASTGKVLEEIKGIGGMESRT